MSQAVLVIHGAGEPRRRESRIYWEPLLQGALGPGYDVHAPRMPDPEDPQHQAWAERITELMAPLDRPVLVGHSFGASTLLKVIAQANPRPAFRGLFLIATPYWGCDFPEYALTAAELQRLQAVSPIYFYQTRDDAVVDVAHFERFAQALPNAVFRLLDGRGHEFNQASFPELAADIHHVTHTDRQG